MPALIRQVRARTQRTFFYPESPTCTECGLYEASLPFAEQNLRKDAGAALNAASVLATTATLKKPEIEIVVLHLLDRVSS